MSDRRLHFHFKHYQTNSDVVFVTSPSSPETELPRDGTPTLAYESYLWYHHMLTLLFLHLLHEILTLAYKIFGRVSFVYLTFQYKAPVKIHIANCPIISLKIHNLKYIIIQYAHTTQLNLLITIHRNHK